MDIRIQPLTAPAAWSAPVEIVERKGAGHPDTMCDALCDELSRALSRFYLERFGVILHHNVDKGLLFGGVARPAFGGGAVVEPIEIYLTGRATRSYRGTTVPVEEIARQSTHAWLRSRLRALDPDQHVRLHCLIRPSSTGLVDLFERGRASGVVLANDTSYGVGFAPLDPLERVVLEVERQLNSAAVKSAHPEIGEDVKVMGVRHDAAIALTVACAFVDRHVEDLPDYMAKKTRVGQLAAEAARAIVDQPVDVTVNAADGDDEDSVYLTVIGTSAEAGDDGQVGRGNRVNGLITPYRPMSLEAVAGKNPVSHVGKLYNVLATRLARAVVGNVPDVSEASCYLVSCIGRPVREPQVVDLRVRLAEAAALPGLRTRLTEVVQDHLRSLDTLWRDLVFGDEVCY